MGNKDRFKVISLFSGCGGLDKGFEGGFSIFNKNYSKLPFKVIFSNDLMDSACETFKLNFDISPEFIFCGDIEELLKNNKSKIPRTNVDVVTGGFPCQDFSFAGKRRGLKSKRGNLYKKMKQVIELSRPKIFVAENVKGLTKFGRVLETIKKEFSNSNPEYVVFHKLLMAADFGVPQRRERVFIIGIRKDVFETIKLNDENFNFMYPVPTHKSKWISSREAIDDLEKKNSHLDRQDQFSKAKNYGSHLQGNKPICGDEVSPTIRAEHHGNIEFHYNGHRRLSVRECARLQSFPDDFKFFGSASKAYVQIGNAVPPILAWHIAKSVKQVLDKYEKIKRSQEI